MLLLGGAGAATVLLGELFAGSIRAADAPRQGRLATYPRKRIGKLSELAVDKPTNFQYPDRSLYSVAFVVKLGTEAGGGVGPDRDVVAFSSLCSHQGQMLTGLYNAEHKVAGSCPMHLTTYDLRRHGMVIAGHATQGLPQVVLEMDGDDIYAVGVLGLIYGQARNVQ